MDRERFEAIVAAYGADERRWPGAERADAAAFAASHADAARILEEARALDRVLEADVEPVRVSDLLAARILRQAPKAAPRVSVWRPVYALAACAVFGLVIGVGGGVFVPAATNGGPPTIETARNDVETESETAGVSTENPGAAETFGSADADFMISAAFGDADSEWLGEDG